MTDLHQPHDYNLRATRPVATMSDLQEEGRNGRETSKHTVGADRTRDAVEPKVTRNEHDVPAVLKLRA